jgi:hypothetical protein
MRVHIIFYSLSRNVDVFSINLHRKYHFRENLNNKLCLDNPLFRSIIYMTIILEDYVEYLFLSLSQLDEVRVGLVM